MRRVIAFVFVSFLVATAAADATPQQCIAHNEKSIDLRGRHALVESREELLQCALPACPPEIRGECERRLLVVNAEMPSIVISAKDPAGADLIDVRVSIDGGRTMDRLDGTPLTLDPGPHVFRFETARARTEARILVREGEKDRPVRVTIGELPRTLQTHKSPVFRALGASVASVGLAGVVVGLVFGGLASAAWSSSENECRSPTNCPNHAGALQDHDDAISFATISTVAFALGGVAIASGAALFFLAPNVTRERASLTVGARF